MTSDQPAGRKAYFEELYQGDADPWRYESCPYEIAKRAHTLSALGPWYGRACEVGCSIGVLTAELAPRCGRLLGLDVSPTAVGIAKARLSDVKNVEVRVQHLPREDLQEAVDLLVLSEVLYFMNEAELEAMARLAARRVSAGGDLLVVSYEGPTQTKLDGRASTALFLEAAAGAFQVERFDQMQEYHLYRLGRRTGGG